MTAAYHARLVELTAARGNLCVGVDPHEPLVRAWGYDYDLVGLERVSRGLVEAIGDQVAVFKPQAAFYMFPKIESNHWKTDKDFVLDILHQSHVLLVPGSGFCPEYGKDHFRMVFLPDEEILGNAFDSIESYMRKVA